MSLTLHEAARRLAAQGCPVFPCIVNGKKPACPNGFRDATTDLKQIDAWWGEANYNIGVCPDDVGRCVIDIDSPDGSPGDDLAGDLPDTYTVKTPRGGRHLWYDGQLPSTVRTLGASCDTRGSGGYVLVPPSEVNGVRYEILRDVAPARLPDWVSLAVRKSNRTVAEPPRNIDEGTAFSRGLRCINDLVGRGHVSIQGAGGHNRCFQIACQLRDLGCTQEQSSTLLKEHWNDHCIPAWDADELDTIIQNAYQYGQNPPGIDAVAPVGEAFAQFLGSDWFNKEEPAKRSAFYAYSGPEQAEWTPPKWLVPDVIPEFSTNLWHGPSGTFKSFQALDCCLAIVHGTSTIFGTTPTATGPTFYAASEGRINMGTVRRAAWELTHGITDKSPDFFLMRAPRLAMPAEMQKFREELERGANGRKPQLIVLDTLSKILNAGGLSENKTEDGSIFTAFCQELIDLYGCSVIAIHHDNKQGDARGNGVFVCDMDSQIHFIGEEMHRLAKLVKVKVIRHKDADERTKPWYFRGRPYAGSLIFKEISKFEFTHDVTAAEQKEKLLGDDAD